MTHIANILHTVERWCEATGTDLEHETLLRYMEKCVRAKGGFFGWNNACEELRFLRDSILFLSVGESKNALDIIEDWCDVIGHPLAHEALQTYFEECFKKEGRTLDSVCVSQKLDSLSKVSLHLIVHIENIGLAGESFSG